MGIKNVLEKAGHSALILIFVIFYFVDSFFVGAQIAKTKETRKQNKKLIIYIFYFIFDFRVPVAFWEGSRRRKEARNKNIYF